jgi:hypothetical protein
MNKHLLATAALAVIVSTTAFAADMPLKAPPPVAVAAGNWSFWIDGMYENVRLPSSALGIHTSNLALPNTDLGPAQSFDPRLNGGGVRGGIGYTMPGPSARFELGGSYVAAKGSASQATVLSTSLFTSAEPVLLNGTVPGLAAFNCFGPFTCGVAGTVNTSYSAWQINGKAAIDRKLGAITVTPSVAIFGGNSRNDQSLSQAFTQMSGGAVINTGSYSANASLRWTDFGGRVGLDGSIPVASALTFGLGGWVGGVSRTVSLSGSDASSFTATFFNGASTVSAGDSRGVLLANAEASLAYAISPTLMVRGFGGVNYDGSVPGIRGPSYTGSFLGPTSTTAAGINYAHETSYYAGGGFQWRL